ncbi:MAG: hypothetical protein PHH49_01370 [Candidatus Omnitrophica bacterium]|nr:hypothetical protein [Candidatus Omnitrophota bacterium]MDD5487593.1 hypothetical protein [Candidatus Omnitrophota bacterium]
MRSIRAVSWLVAVSFLCSGANVYGAEQKMGFWDKVKAKYSKGTVSSDTAQPAKVSTPPESAAPTAKKKPDRQQMLDTIARRLKVFTQIADEMPGLSARQDVETGEVSYYYAEAGNIPEELEKLEEEDLYKLYVRINQRATILNSERIQNMLAQQERVRTLQNLQRVPQGGSGAPAQAPRPPVTPVQTPRAYVPPSVPTIPSAPVRAPSVPSAPPSPPAVRR